VLYKQCSLKSCASKTGSHHTGEVGAGSKRISNINEIFPGKTLLNNRQGMQDPQGKLPQAPGASAASVSNVQEKPSRDRQGMQNSQEKSAQVSDVLEASADESTSQEQTSSER